MKLYKVDTKNWTVREVDGEPWPGSDSDGENCYLNTHFAEPKAAWDKLTAEALAWVELAARDVERSRAAVLQYERDAADAAIALQKVLRQSHVREAA